MVMQQEVEIAAPYETVWTALRDSRFAMRMIAGLQSLEPEDDSQLTGILADGGRFHLSLQSLPDEHSRLIIRSRQMSGDSMQDLLQRLKLELALPTGRLDEAAPDEDGEEVAGIPPAMWIGVLILLTLLLLIWLL